MGAWLCRVEGVNFNTTVFDTNDLSTVRGASLGLLHLDRAVTAALPEAQGVFSGASQCAVVVDREGDEATVARELRETINAVLTDRTPVWMGMDKKAETAPPFPALTTVIDVVPLENRDKETVATALDLAEARNRTRQFRQWTLDPLEVSTDGKDVGAFEHGRPGTVEVPLPEGKGRPRVLTGDEDDTLTDPENEKATTKRLSFAVAAKRAYGRTARQDFYLDELGADGRALLGTGKDRLGFVDSLEDMPHADWTKSPLKAMPQSVRNKIAVVYADGNGFGRIREQVGVEAFSTELAALRKTLLKTIITWFVGHARGAQYHDLFLLKHKRNGHDRSGLRLETLMWGGDELLFAMPAWLALPFAAGLHAATKDWAIGGQPLSHAVGITVAHHKTPIRQLTRLAHEAADGAKAAGLKDHTTVTVDVFESLAPPDAENGLDRARDRLFGAPDPSTGEAAVGEMERACLLAMPGDALATFISGLASEKQKDEDAALPRSQMYAALRAARAETPCLADDAAAAAVRDALDTYAGRMGKGALDDVFPARLRPPSVAERPLGLDLALVTELWDYIHPGGLDIPPMTVTENRECGPGQRAQVNGRGLISVANGIRG
ncbi:hypothetical protein SAMN05421720_109155 [Rhodospira trueperi]|uniref:Cas10/Cmr2 second palm domain-containing protein n=2 Tax=Rhodospira trueperi TaxID=69960 RepID=A0A1G7EQ93_9PROT|nr:hypothetical protein SAMN05421720_109155 [Rhodospira trueperi]